MGPLSSSCPESSCHVEWKTCSGLAITKIKFGRGHLQLCIRFASGYRVRQEAYIFWSALLASDDEFLVVWDLLQFKRRKTWLDRIIWDSHVCILVLTSLLHSIRFFNKLERNWNTRDDQKHNMIKTTPRFIRC